MSYLQKHLPAPPPSPCVALVGRPNVGKSTLFNRLVGRRLALVYDEPGVTRDRLVAACIVPVQEQLHLCRLTDTAGLLGDDAEPLVKASQLQTVRSMLEADLALLVVDGRAGLSPFDREAARLLRRRRAPFAVVVNKVDHGETEAQLSEFHALGALHCLAISAEHNRGMDALRAFVGHQLHERGLFGEGTAWSPESDEQRGKKAAASSSQASEDVAAATAAALLRAIEVPQAAGGAIEWSGGPIRVAVLGRPNAGKSSLVNALLGEERFVASPTAGTTRDSIDAEIEVDGQRFVFVDTAGIRRQSRIKGRLEAISVSLALRSLEQADVVALVLNGTEQVSDQDAKIAALAEARGKGLVLIATQWDRIENPEWKQKYPEAVRHDLGFVSYAPLVKTSAVSKVGLADMLAAIEEVQRERHRRIGTGTLNRFLADVVDSHPPPMRRGKRPQLAYITQPMVRPPTFVISARRSGTLDDSYTRYLVRQLRLRYGFGGTPVWVKFRSSNG